MLGAPRRQSANVCSSHLLPSGLINPKCTNLIGFGVVFHSFFEELAELEEGVRGRIFVSDRCHVNFDLHAAVDGLEEDEVRNPTRVHTTSMDIGCVRQLVCWDFGSTKVDGVV